MNYQPHEYPAVRHGLHHQNPTAAVFLEMGLGKSVIALTAILELCLERFEISRVLVIAPLRVARDTWPAEIQKWDHLKGLTYSVAVGTANERRQHSGRRTFVHIINRENVQWLIEDSGIPWQYDMVVIDELSSFKSHQSKRFKSLMKARPRRQAHGRTHRHTLQQRSDGSLVGVPCAGHGQTSWAVHHTLPGAVL